MILDIVVVGLTITSSWGNGHATTYRGLAKALARRGHRVTFLERDVAWYRQHRDLPDPTYCRVELYKSLHEFPTRYSRLIADADLVILGSYVPGGAVLGDNALGFGTWGFLSVILLNIWRGGSFVGIFLLAARNGIPDQLFEYASLEARSAWQMFWKVTVPVLRPFLALAAFLTLTGAVGEDSNMPERGRGQPPVPIEFLTPNPRHPRRNLSDADPGQPEAGLGRAPDVPRCWWFIEDRLSLRRAGRGWRTGRGRCVPAGSHLRPVTRAPTPRPAARPAGWH